MATRLSLELYEFDSACPCVYVCVRGNVFTWCEPQWRRLHATVDAAVRWAPGLCELLNKGHQREFSHFQIQEPQLSRHSIYTSKSGEAELKVRVLATKMFFYYPPKQDYVMELTTNLGWIF